MPVREALRIRRRAAVTPAFDDQITWVFGSPRSGSTWLLYLLADHPAVVPINEPLIGHFLGPFLSDQPGASSEGLESATFTMRRLNDRAPQFFCEEFADVWAPALGDLMRKRFHAHALRYPADEPLERTRVLVKEPNGSQSADVLLRALPASRVVFLLRDGRDVVDSELAASRPGAWVAKQFPGWRGIDDSERLDFVRDAARKWLWRTEVVQTAFEEHPGPKLLLRYEDLLAEPRTHLRTLMDWLALDISEAGLEHLVDTHAFERIPSDQRGSDRFYRSATPGGWRENLRPEEQRALSAVLDEKLRELDYVV